MILDPRRSLAAGVMWLIIALAFTFSIAAAAWVGRIARQHVVEQHIRRLALETDLLASELDEALASRLAAVRAAENVFRSAAASRRPAGLADFFSYLTSTYPGFDWIAIADVAGKVVSSDGELPEGMVTTSTWYSTGSRRVWIGVIEEAAKAKTAVAADGMSGLGDMAVPVRDGTGAIVGVIAAHLSWRRAPDHPSRLTDESDPRNAAQAFILDRHGLVLAGPDGFSGKPWEGRPVREQSPAPTALASENAGRLLQFQRLSSGEEVLVSREPLNAGAESSAGDWLVQLSEPNQRVYQRAEALAAQILWVSLCLGALTAVLGILGARYITGRLQRLAVSVANAGQNQAGGFEVPEGVDEVAQLGSAFAKILGDLQQERSELERRVAVRTREVQRLAEESRYAAIVRERLKIARDLHDTLAHSMMAMLSEIRLLRRLYLHDPQAVPAELIHAEEVAHHGLNEARSAISQIRSNAVRETGLGPALSTAFQHFLDRTGIAGDFSADAEAARFGDERAETLLRMAQEIFRNIEQHAMATRVTVKLRITDGMQLELLIEDNGVGFDSLSIPKEHYGILGLREQAELIGAALLIDSKSNQGTKLSISLRLSPEAFSRIP
ncbi:MAG TPA: histidine kinase [Steroidobacteraceae bacterium]